MTAAEADAVLAYLKLNLLSLLPGKENIVRHHEEEGLHPQVLFSLHGIDENSGTELAEFVAQRIASHFTLATGEQVRFCLGRLTDVAPMQWILLSLKLNLTKREVYNRLDDLRINVENSIKSHGQEEHPLTGFRSLWRLLLQLAAGEELVKHWWDLDYLPPTKGDVDDYMRHLRKIININPDNWPNSHLQRTRTDQ